MYPINMITILQRALPMPDRIVIDTSAFYALISTNDSYHEKAKDYYEKILDREYELFTTSYVLVESSALVHHRLGFMPLKVLMESIQLVVKIIWIDNIIHNEAWKEMIIKEGSQV